MNLLKVRRVYYDYYLFFYLFLDFIRCFGVVVRYKVWNCYYNVIKVFNLVIKNLRKVGDYVFLKNLRLKMRNNLFFKFRFCFFVKRNVNYMYYA